MARFTFKHLIPSLCNELLNCLEDLHFGDFFSTLEFTCFHKNKIYNKEYTIDKSFSSPPASELLGSNLLHTESKKSALIMYAKFCHQLSVYSKNEFLEEIS